MFEVLSDETPRIRSRVRVETHRPTVIAGLNSTLKSLTAKAIAYTILVNYMTKSEESFKLMKKDLLEEYFRLTPITVNLIEGSLNQDEFIGLLLEDYRIVTRFVISRLGEELNKVEESLLSDILLYIEDKDQRKYVEDEIKKKFQKLKYVINPLVNDLLELKIMSIDRKLKRNFEILYDIVNKVCDEFKEELKPSDVLPLEVSIIAPEKIYVRDTRLEVEVSSEAVSTAIASALQFLIITYAFATKHNNRVIIVEEPEESMTPIQQVTFMRYLSTLMKDYGGMNIVIVTTHSPYIAFATDSINHIALYDYKEKLFKIVESDIPRSFTYADILLVR